MNKDSMRALIEGFYDLQKTRIQTGNRILANTYAKLGIKPGEKKEDGLTKEEAKILKQIVQDFRRITDGVILRRRQIRQALLERGTSLISTEAEYALVDSYTSYLVLEDTQLKHIKAILDEFPIWTEFLAGVKGIGPTMAGVIISRLDPHKAMYPSSFWKYSGLDVGPDGRGRGKYTEHLVDVKYTAKNGEEKTKKSLTYSPWLKSKLVGVLAQSFIYQKTPKYYELYVDYKNRMANHPKYKDERKVVHHRMAARYMVKIFLLDLWKKWRELEGLPVHEPYHVAKLGLRDHAA